MSSKTKTGQYFHTHVSSHILLKYFSYRRYPQSSRERRKLAEEEASFLVGWLGFFSFVLVFFCLFFVFVRSSVSPPSENYGHIPRKLYRLARKQWVFVKALPKSPHTILERISILWQNWTEKLILTMCLHPRDFNSGSRHKYNALLEASYPN